MLQGEFLEKIVQARISVTIYLTNGIRLLGHIDSYDQYGIVLGGTTQQFIYKHAISTIVPARDVTSHNDTAAAEPADKPAPESKPTTTLRPRIKRPPAASS